MKYSAFDKKTLIIGKMKSLTRSGIEKPIILIRAFLTVPKVHQPVVLLLPDGREIETSNVIGVLLGGQTYIETESTIYVDARFWEAR